MYYAKSNKSKQTIRILKDGLLCFVPPRHGLAFVIVHAIAAVLLLSALCMFFAGLKKESQQKTYLHFIFCAPARLGRLRGCHSFCPLKSSPQSLKNSASPLRKRSAALPTAYGRPLGTPAKPDAQEGAAVVNGSTSSAICLQAYPLSAPIVAFGPSHNCGLPIKKLRLWHYSSGHARNP